ncbi:MAG: molybdate ABC transporter substrate-binding protein [Burkholderiales bacterium]
MSTQGAKGQIAVICTMSCKEALIELVPEFEHETGYRVEATYGAGPELTKQISGGMRADIFVGPEEFSGPLIDEGRLVRSSRTAFAHSGAALAIKAGARKPDISSPEKLKATLLAAKLVKPRPGEMVGPVLVRGEADIGVQQPAELLPVKGIEIIGPLPPELRQTIVYGATVFTGSTQSEGNRVFIEFLKSEPARKVLRHTGLDPV